MDISIDSVAVRSCLLYPFSFVNHPKKYRLVERDLNPVKARKVEFCLKSDIPSKLPKTLQDLMKEMVSTLQRFVYLHEWSNYFELLIYTY